MKSNKVLKINIGVSDTYLVLLAQHFATYNNLLYSDYFKSLCAQISDIELNY